MTFLFLPCLLSLLPYPGSGQDYDGSHIVSQDTRPHGAYYYLEPIHRATVRAYGVQIEGNLTIHIPFSQPRSYFAQLATDF